MARERPTGDTERKHYFVTVPDSSPASRTMTRVKQGPMTESDAETEVERLNRHSDRRYRAQSGEQLNLFPHLVRDDREREADADTDRRGSE